MANDIIQLKEKVTIKDGTAKDAKTIQINLQEKYRN